MSKVEALRALVSDRLAAAAEDIFVLFERTMAEYEEELSRFKEENRRKQQLLDSAVSLRTDLLRGNVHVPSPLPEPLNQEIAETPLIKKEPEEQNVRPETEQLKVSAPESSASVCVKTEESSLLQQRLTEHAEETRGEETQGEGPQGEGTPGEVVSFEPHFHLDTVGHREHFSNNHTHWSAPFSVSDEQMETQAEGNHYIPFHVREIISNLSPQTESAPESTVHSGNASGAEGRRHQCPVCSKSFSTKQVLQRHIRIHTGERPYSCSICNKSFTQDGHLTSHKRTHTGERPYSCFFCNKHFVDSSALRKHRAIHTGERPYSCSNCKLQFTDPSSLRRHERTHTGEKPYSCLVCDRAFPQKYQLQSHVTCTHSI